MFFTRSTHDNPSHIDVASVLCPTAAVYKHHLTHTDSHEENYDSECASGWMLEGVGEPTVITRLAFDDYDIVKWSEIQERKVRGTHWVSVEIR